MGPVLLPPGEGVAKRGMRGARPTIHQVPSTIGRSGLPSPGASRHPLPEGEGAPPKQASNLTTRPEAAPYLNLRPTPRSQFGQMCLVRRGGCASKKKSRSHLKRRRRGGRSQLNASVSDHPVRSRCGCFAIFSWGRGHPSSRGGDSCSPANVRQQPPPMRGICLARGASSILLLFWQKESLKARVVYRIVTT